MRGITEGEWQLLHHIVMWGSKGYPVRKCGRGWVWGDVYGVKGPPEIFRTRRDAVVSFERFMDVLRDAEAGRI